MTPPTDVPGPSNRPAAIRTGVRLEIVTVLWMVVEAVLAIGSGILARSVLLTAFGFDSVIELISGGLLLWRLAVEARGGQPALPPVERVARTEHQATRIAAWLLVALCVYLVGASATGLVAQVKPDAAPLGLAVSVAALVVMPLLAWRKRRVNEVLDSAALRADVAETITCAYMAGTVVGGLVLNALFGWWWAEYVAAAGLLWWLVGETREAWEAARGAAAPDTD